MSNKDLFNYDPGGKNCEQDKENKRAGEIWSQRYETSETKKLRTKWEHSETVIRHISSIICGEEKTSIPQAIEELLRKIQTKPFKYALSIGCGLGRKEMSLVQNGLVESFDLYDFSEYAVEHGKAEAERCGLAAKMNFKHGDAFKDIEQTDCYDFIYWDNALHHMPNAHAAVNWSKNILTKNGCFFMYDYIGPSRFQWTNEQISIVRNILEGLGDDYFLIPETEYMWKKEPSRMTVEETIEADPTEAADSDNIVPAFRSSFPEGTVIPLGGLVYVLALDGILINMPEDSQLLKRLLKLDAMLSKFLHNYYAVGYAFK